MKVAQQGGQAGWIPILNDSSDSVEPLEPASLLVDEVEGDRISYAKRPPPSPPLAMDVARDYVAREQSVKESNPKDAVGIKKAPFSTVPARVTAEVGLALLEGALKYGRHNYRAIGARSSVYYDAAMRHLSLWWEGQDIDSDSGLSHITKAMACLVVLRDAENNGKLTDDRPPSERDQLWMRRLNDAAAKLVEKYPAAPAAYVREEP